MAKNREGVKVSDDCATLTGKKQASAKQDGACAMIAFLMFGGFMAVVAGGGAAVLHLFT